LVFTPHISILRNSPTYMQTRLFATVGVRYTVYTRFDSLFVALNVAVVVVTVVVVTV